MVEIDSAFGGLTEVKTWGSSRPITPGTYLLRIKEFRKHKSVDPKKGNTSFFIVISEVEFVSYAEGEDHIFEKGDEISWMINMNQPSAKNNLINFLTKVFEPEGWTQPNFTDPFVAALFDKETFLAKNREMLAKAYEITTQAGKPFTKVDWQVYVEPEDDEAAQAEAPAGEQAEASASDAAAPAA